VELCRVALPRAWIQTIRDDQTPPVSRDDLLRKHAGFPYRVGRGCPVGYVVVYIKDGWVWAGASMQHPRDQFNRWIGQAEAFRSAIEIIRVDDPKYVVPSTADLLKFPADSRRAVQYIIQQVRARLAKTAAVAE
jgi:hypothetical protein